MPSISQFFCLSRIALERRSSNHDWGKTWENGHKRVVSGLFVWSFTKKFSCKSNRKKRNTSTTVSSTCRIACHEGVILCRVMPVSWFNRTTVVPTRVLDSFNSYVKVVNKWDTDTIAQTENQLDTREKDYQDLLLRNPLFFSNADERTWTFTPCGTRT